MYLGRITNFVYDASSRCVYAGCDKGLIYALSTDLQEVRRSAPTTHGAAIHAITAHASGIITRDVAGNVVHWDRETLAPRTFVLSQYCTDDAEASAVPSPSNALLALGDELLVTNACGSLCVLGLPDLDFRREIDIETDAFIEKVVALDDQILVADVMGRIHAGTRHGDTFRKVAEVKGGVVHSLVFDQRHQRVWCTSDVTGGIFLLDRQGGFAGELRFTNDDVEEIAIDADARHVYVGCFDHYVHVFDNDLEPREQRVIGPFKFQINHLALLDDQTLLVLLESGELSRVDLRTDEVLATVGGSDAVWDIQLRGQQACFATEGGHIEVWGLQARGRALSLQRAAPPLRVPGGRIRRLRCLEDGGWLGCSSDGSVWRVDASGRERWRHQTLGITRDLDLDARSGEVLVVNEVGRVLLLGLADGQLLREIKRPRPVWCAAFDGAGQLLIGERRLKAAGQGDPSLLSILDARDLSTRQVLEHTGNHKSIRLLAPGKVLITGNGNIGVQILDTRSGTVERSFQDWIVNTPEAALLLNEQVHVISYGYQMITFDLGTGEATDVQHVLEGYPGALVHWRSPQGHDFLLAGGRNFVMGFHVQGSAPELVMTHYTSAPTADAQDWVHRVGRHEPPALLERTLRSAVKEEPVLA